MLRLSIGLYLGTVWRWVIGQPGIREVSVFSELLILGCAVTYVHTRVRYYQRWARDSCDKLLRRGVIRRLIRLTLSD